MSRDQYVPETVNLLRPALQDLKAQVRQMKPEDQTMLKAPDSDMLLNMVMSQTEMEPIKAEVNKYFGDVKSLAGKDSKKVTIDREEHWSSQPGA